MASAVDYAMKERFHRTHRRSKELLKPPKGPGVKFLQNENIKKKQLISEPPKIFKMDRSSVLSRVQSFLPVMKEADKELRKRIQTETSESLDIEAVADGEACIEMDLAVMPVNDQSSDSSSSNSCSELSDSDSDCITCTSDSVQQKPSIIRTSKRPQIEEVGEL